ncbi:DNA-binding transcriptional repressor MalI [Vibrio crassostreae]|uniref:Mal regulon transcriptional regulator MalI n=1 Tax=Vibrio TaxID=662 RepID=UPI0007EEAD5C|nr:MULTISPECIES: Mal regulon transcriptional regulator MalI [Vibrio]OBT17561.1 Mal regulon transcriptional regulator MalI [Vibrio tasmaniensis]MBE8566509.1 Mal regulon transcriptional regulator MalI [Vibrio sp. OPT20]TCN90879.1 LacI family transcriptional regulator [Vibrio crassostreae]CAK2427961.1 DNA-binding transcriptional repressor MalI [Vibrio crassostreae]CAK2490192.1 DNA-binding transcriptional repressor MalI [Vibrio crassostreae]
MTNKKANIKDVAERAGVSVTTVSMVLSAKGRISTDTIDKVNQAVHDLGYIKNRSASNLRSQKSALIGLILRDISDPYYAEVTAGLSEVLEDKGYMLFLAQSGTNQDKFDQCIATMVAQGVGGIVFCPIRDIGVPNIDKVKELNVPIVCVARAKVGQQIDFVGPDNMQAAKIATEYLIKQGHRQIAYVGGQSDSLSRAERLGGYCSTLMQFGLPFKPEWVIECDKSQTASAEAVNQLINKNPKITALLCHYSSTAFGAVYGVNRSNRSVGKDNYIGQQVAIIGFDDVPEAELIQPSLTFVSTPVRDIGREAGHRLISQLENKDSIPQSVILTPELIARDSA